MHEIISGGVRALLILASVALLSPSFAQAQGYQLVWSDEFDGGALDLTGWSTQLGTGCPDLCGWGNNELQYYRSQNATVNGGLLTITAKEESWGGQDYTSARIRSINKFDFTYGRIEARAKLPIGRGLWPAFWLLFTNDTYGGWAASGEIDIMEAIGQDPDRIFGTIHYGGQPPGNVSSSAGDYVLPTGTYNDDFHEFALEWEPGELRWYLDGILFGCRTDWYSTGGEYPAPFDHDMHILLNLAVGGNLPGSPDGSTSFPQDFVVDYVRVYQKPEFPGCRIVFAGMDDAQLFGGQLDRGWFIFTGNGSGSITYLDGTVPPEDGCVGSMLSSWGGGGPFLGGFGRSNPHDLTDMTHFSFWIDPDPGQTYTLQMQFQDDDNGDDNIPPTPDGQDDEFQYNVTVGSSGSEVIAGGGWQRVRIPLASLYDDNSFHWGGDGIFNPTPTSAGGNGQLINVVATVINIGGSSAVFRTDRWEFTREEGTVEGTIWSDLDGDGVLDGGESGISGVNVQVFDDAGLLLANDMTDGSGLYTLPSLPGGEHRVVVDNADIPSGSTPTADPDGVATPDEAWIAIDCSGTTAGQDFGYEPSQLGIPDPEGPNGPRLWAAFPNPFTFSTRIAFDLQRETHVDLVVFDLAGREVRRLQRSVLSAGSHVAVWDGKTDGGVAVASGFYLIALATEQDTRTRRVLMLRP